MNSKSLRTRELGAIHIAAKSAGLDDDAYRAMLQAVCGVRSAADLDAAGRRQVLDHLRRQGQPSRSRARLDAAAHTADRPRNFGSAERGPLLAKIEALLTAQRLPWAYAQGIARRVAKKDRLEFCAPAELVKVVAALTYQQRRWRRKA